MLSPCFKIAIISGNWVSFELPLKDGTSMPGEKILIVEDDKDLLEGLDFLFSSHGYDVISATDSFSAINTVQTEKPDVIILDLSLPGGDGYHVMDRLKSFTPFTHIPIIVLTARDASINRERALKAGAEAFFQKPFDNGQLLAVTEKVLEGLATEKVSKGPGKKKILVVDDDKDLREGLNLLFTSQGYDVFFAMDAVSVVGVALKKKPDVILLDLSLPGGDGYQVMKRLRSFSPLTHIPIIVLTARDASINQRRALKEGAEAFFQKPFDNNELIAAVEKSLGKSGVC